MWKTTLVIFGLIIGTSAHGQRIGFRSGLNLAKTGGDSQNLVFKYDVHLGLFWSKALGKKLISRLDATYSRQGGQVDPRLVNDWVINNNYINVTPAIGFEPNDRLRFLLGPQVGIRLNGRSFQPGFLDENHTSALSLFSLSLTSEIQYRVQEIISLYVRYGHGLTSNVSQESLATGRLPDRVFQVGIAVDVISK